MPDISRNFIFYGIINSNEQMKKLPATAIILLFTFCGYAQICKTVKPGMISADVLKVAGLPDSTTFLGTNKGTTDSLIIWHYGSQDALLIGGKVEKVMVDPKRESELSQKVLDGNLSPEDFERQLEELNQNSCK